VLATRRKLHRHEVDYFYVVISGGVLQGKNADGSNKPVQELSDGGVRFREIDGEDIHEAVNIGDQPWRNIVVELKEPRTGWIKRWSETILLIRQLAIVLAGKLYRFQQFPVASEVFCFSVKNAAITTGVS
jgi:hypothetical protein